MQDVTAMHVSIRRNGDVSVSTQIASLRQLLSGKLSDELGIWFQKVTSVRNIYISR